MTTDELLMILPKEIGNHQKNGKFVLQSKYDEIGDLMLTHTGTHWQASYGIYPFVCLNPQDEHVSNWAVAFGNTPNEALQGLYDWCVRNRFIK